MTTQDKKNPGKAQEDVVDSAHLTNVEGGHAEKWRAVHRVILPASSDADSLALYLDSGSVAAGNQPDAPAAAGSAGDAHSEDLLSRRSMKVRLGSRVSFATYFNAFPASYWRRWTVVDQVRLNIRTSGQGTLIVYRSNAKGAAQRVQSVAVNEAAQNTFELSLKPFGDGGWYWFDMIAKDENFILEEAAWEVPDQGRPQGTYSIGVTTFNRPDYCNDVLRVISASDEVRSQLREVIIVDQGTQKVRDEEGFDQLEAALGDQLKLIHQANVGGSGGFSRCMYEASENSDADYVILLDDDIILEPESFLRLCEFADHCRKPTLVGGHMFDMYNRTVLHTMGEVVNQWRFQPGLPSKEMWMGHDFAGGSLRRTTWMHRRVDVDYNGWWMCLIPTKVIKEIGLSLPVFIKWDDVEYGLRAKQAGYPTVSLPGAAVWHVSWADKDDLVGWQAYFHIRNRMIASMIHSGYDLGGRVVRESQYEDVKHIVSMQYYTQEGRNLAMRDLLQGPEVLHGLIDKRLPEIRGMAKEFSDSVFSPDVDAFPEPKLTKPPKKTLDFSKPEGVVGKLAWTGKTVVRQALGSIKGGSKERPQALVAHQDSKWWLLSQYDSVVVSNAEGTAASWYRRDPKTTRAQLGESMRLHARLVSEWPRLRREFREALPRITSASAWKETFDRISED